MRIDDYVGSVAKLKTEADSRFYFVMDVNHDMNCSSLYLDGSNNTYGQIFSDRHKINFQHPEAPLLEARPLQKNMEFIIPRLTTSKNKRSFHYPIEFMRVSGMSGDYFLKACFMPSILFKVHHLLMADRIRREISVGCGLGAKCLQKVEGLDVIRVDVTSIENLQAFQRSHRISTSPSSSSDEDKENVKDARQQFNFGTIANSVPEISDSTMGNEEKLPVLGILAKKGGNGPRPCEVYEAITAKGVSDVVNLERLEILGDSFLKYAVSLSLFQRLNHNEGILTKLKGDIIKNASLFQRGKKIHLQSRMNFSMFSAKEKFMCPGFGVSDFVKESLAKFPRDIFEIQIPPQERLTGILSDHTRLQIASQELGEKSKKAPKRNLFFDGKWQISDKMVADGVEALIGLYLKTHGVDGALRFLKFMGILDPHSGNVKWESPVLTAAQEKYYAWNWMALEKALGYEFRNKFYAMQAMMHPSYTTRDEIFDGYQRMEFLGDAVLDFLVTVYIYEYCGNLSPGDVTDLRSALTNNGTFAAYAVRLKLHQIFLYSSKTLCDAIEGYVDTQNENSDNIDGSMLTILEDNAPITEVEVPKVLGDIFESAAAAVFLDSGGDLSIVWEIFYKIIKTELRKFARCVPKNAVRLFYEKQKVASDVTFEYSQHSKQTTCLLRVKEEEFVGYGINKKLAKEAACKLAFKHMMKN